MTRSIDLNADMGESYGRWHLGDDPQDRTLHYIAGGAFFATGEAFDVGTST